MYLKINKSNTSLIDSDSSDFSSDDEKINTKVKPYYHTIEVGKLTVKFNKNESEGDGPTSNHIKNPPPEVTLTHQSRYEVIRKVAQKFEFKEVTEDENWDVKWTDESLTVEQCKELKRFQKINHLPGMLELSRKDLMARNLNRMLKIFPNDYNFFPKTWCIPANLNAARKYMKLHKNDTFILKPDAGSQGKGILLTKTLNEFLQNIAPFEKGVCQLYIEKPFLIDGYKFDMRLYVLITSCDPLRIYIYKEGLIRFASCRYEEPNEENLSNVFMHLTNYSINKLNNTRERGIKRKLSWFNSYMKSLKYNIEDIWYRIDEVVVKSILSVYPSLKHIYAFRFPNHTVMPACIELLGLDVLIDEELNPILLEVNYSPSYGTDTELDWEVKEALFTDLFAMMNLNSLSKKMIMREDSKIVTKRLLNKRRLHKPVKDNKRFTEYFKQELANRGGFRLLYPSPIEHDYSKYLSKSTL